MKIKTSSFIKSAVIPSDYPDTNFPEIAFVGRSNVGKSSLINKLLNRKGLAKTSSTPGKTRLINFFLINKDLVFVDLPGYGYAKVSKTERNSWTKMIDCYLSTSSKLKATVLLQDIRRDQTDMDRTMIELLHRYDVPVVLVLTKADKFSRNQQIKRINEIKKGISFDETEMIPFSSTSGLGKDELWESLVKLIGDGEEGLDEKGEKL
jgi:GTP-binding protein